MRHKTILHKIMKNTKPPNFAYEFEAILFKEVALSGFFDNCMTITSLVVNNGSTVNVTDLARKRREQLGLPPMPRFDATEIKRLVEKTGISRRLGEKR